MITGRVLPNEEKYRETTGAFTQRRERKSQW